MALMAASAYLGGLAEALFLVIAMRTAFTITDGSDRVGMVASWNLPISLALGIALLLVAVRVSLSSFAAWQSAKLSSDVVARVRRRLSHSFFDASWAVQQRQKSGSLQELMSTYSGQTSNLMNGVNQAVVAAANLVALLGLAIAVDPLGAFVLVVSVAVLGTVLRPLRAVVRRRGRSSAEAGMTLATTISEASELGLELHVFHVQDAAKTQMSNLIDDARDKNRGLQFASGLATPLYIGLAYAALVGALAFVAMSSATSLTSLGAAMLVMLRSLSYGQALQGAYVQASAATPVIEELGRQFDVLEAGRRHDGGGQIHQVSVLEARDVTYSYAVDKVLEDVSFSVGPHEIIGIVGPSGSGKSTLVQLLLGLREPQSGAILADGRDISDLDRSEWARRVTFVPQEAHLISGTITDNIRFLRDWVTDNDVERAARGAHLHDEIQKASGGYGRLLGGDGGRLSGGQQQRLSIARALIEAPDVLILDEPTSALDVQSEHLVRTTLLDLRDSMTVMVIAHRLSTLEICDRIMVIQDGRLVGFDTPAALQASNEFFREAVELSGNR
ncbi:MAG: ATP-binding cassette subfamily B protein [Ilumatobacter sp.]|jgi:ATP-binding cassette subfamily B protein